MVDFAKRAGLVLAAWIAALALEHLVIGFGYRRLFVAPFEMAIARTAVSPLVVAALVPAAFFAVVLLDGLSRKRWWAAAFAAACGAAIAFGVSSGRHMQSPFVRVPFVIAVAAAGFFFARLVAPRALHARAPTLALAAVTAGVMCWCADAFVLPRLYPAFHHGLFLISLISFGAVGWRARAPRLGLGALAFGALSALWAPFGIAALDGKDNLRLVLAEHAPILGRGVRLATWIRPQKEAVGEVVAFGEIGRSLDWSGRDIVLLSIDALRADHVSAYGYARKTTPNIDALAREGVVFDAAYCATPHTSYSITSMLTGKYMRPLMQLGLGADSQTLATELRAYGYRTAAFYPPAVFFIDEQKFKSFEDRSLDFEYAKIEFAAPDLRRDQVTAYLERREIVGKPLFLWVHFFEPHEPYVMHEDHFFSGGRDIDAYDSEIATADEGIGFVVDAVRARRKNPVLIVTADHGEEFGEHGGRYHGTTVYEEQVRVPLVVVFDHAPKHVSGPVQTIDIVPTVLSALGVPRPARIRGRDLGPALAAKSETNVTFSEKSEKGFAFVETDDQTLVAEADFRLICTRRAGACSLYDTRADPLETRDETAAHAADAERLKGMSIATARSHGKYEGEGADLPEALRRGMQGDIDADADVAALLDDANVGVGRKAASVLYDLKSKRVAAQIHRSSEHDEDEEVKRFSTLALVRIGFQGGEDARGADLLSDPDILWRRRAALAFAERGDPRGDAELASWWAEGRKDLGFTASRDVLAAIGARKIRAAVPALAASLSDVRLRPYVADAIGAVGDASGIAPLGHAFADERYDAARVHEARALAALGAKAELAPLATYAALPDPMIEAISIARDAHLLDPKHGGFAPVAALPSVRATVDAPGRARLIVLLAASEEPRVILDGIALTIPQRSDETRIIDVETNERATVEASATHGVLGFWLIPRSP